MDIDNKRIKNKIKTDTLRIQTNSSETSSDSIKKNRNLRPVIFIAIVLLFATLVAYPYQGALY